MTNLYHTFVFEPLYNGLIWLIDALPFLDAGLIVILFTVLVRVILFPLSKKAARTQIVMKALEPELNALKEKHKDDKQGQAVAIMGFYKKNGINPFSSILLLIVQLPIIFALYRIFYTTGLSSVSADILYSFVAVPAHINTLFLGLVDIAQKSAVLAVVAAVSQFLQIHFSAPKAPAKSAKGGFQDDFARSMHVQMKYVFPIFILFIGYHATGALALYWTTSNLFMIAQELYVRREVAKEMAAKGAVAEAKA